MLKEWIERLAPHTALLLVLASVATLGSAYTFQYFGYEPCTLCWYQRYPYMAVILLSGLAALLCRRNDSPANLILLLVGASIAALFVDSGIAVFHVGVEQNGGKALIPVAAAASGLATASKTCCSSCNPLNWCAATKPHGPCSEFPWRGIMPPSPWGWDCLECLPGPV